MTQALQAMDQHSLQTGAQVEWSREQIELLKRTICKGATDDELSLFIQASKRLGLDPFARQIHAVKRWDSTQRREVMSIQVSIDGYRLAAERSGKYQGQVGPFWCGRDGKWVDVWLNPDPPAAAKVGVWRVGAREPIWGVARFDAYKATKKDGSLTRMWAQMADVMIAKCAEALALRKAFPQELSGVYTQEEMQQADSERPERAPYQPPPVQAYAPESLPEVVDAPPPGAQDAQDNAPPPWPGEDWVGGHQASPTEMSLFEQFCARIDEAAKLEHKEAAIAELARIGAEVAKKKEKMSSDEVAFLRDLYAKARKAVGA